MYLYVPRTFFQLPRLVLTGLLFIKQLCRLFAASIYQLSLRRTAQCEHLKLDIELALTEWTMQPSKQHASDSPATILKASANRSRRLLFSVL